MDHGLHEQATGVPTLRHFCGGTLGPIEIIGNEPLFEAALCQSTLLPPLAAKPPGLVSSRAFLQDQAIAIFPACAMLVDPKRKLTEFGQRPRWRFVFGGRGLAFGRTRKDRAGNDDHQARFTHRSSMGALYEGHKCAGRPGADDRSRSNRAGAAELQPCLGAPPDAARGAEGNLGWNHYVTRDKAGGAYGLGRAVLKLAYACAMCGLAALAGCAGTAVQRDEFHLTADQVNSAWGVVMARAHRDAAEQGIDPLWDPVPPSFSGATCRWVEPGRQALCRYSVARGHARPGSERQQVTEEASLYLSEAGWHFGY